MEDLPDYGKIVFPPMIPQPLAAFVPRADDLELSLLTDLLSMAPARRPKADEVTPTPCPPLLRDICIFLPWLRGRH